MGGFHNEDDEYESHILNLIDKFNKNIEFKWSCLSTINNINENLLKKMKLNGCQYISYGVESGNEEIFKKYVKKPMNINKIIQTSILTHSIGLDHYGFFIVGFPEENWNTVNDTCNLILKSKFKNGGINILIPLPGTYLWKILFEKRKLFTLNELNWDYLFARGENDEYSLNSAELASRWCFLSGNELINVCKIYKRCFI